MKLQAVSVGQRAGSRALVSDVSLTVQPGETLGLIGPNGSGKSTMLRIIAGLAPRASGAVLLDDVPMAQMTRRDIARKIALVQQHADTSEALTVRDAVELGRTPWLSALRPLGDDDRDIVDQALASVGMSRMARAEWATLSGGERQRVHIARALAQRPRVLLLDEPTNHLDIHHQLAILRMMADLPVTVVVALHDLNQAMGCDRLAVMQKGRLIACGPPAQVLTPARLAQIFRVDTSVLRDPADGATLFRFHCLKEPT